ncbi:MAG: sigma 54-interacting transcriptional regulator [Clostridiales bacterium]|nr:sigma 54-interacting transcriptional regulator [Clostridiales bacterium]
MTEKEQTIEALRAENARLTEEIESLRRESVTAFLIGDAVADGICVTDGNSVVTRINRGYTEITGITEADILGRNVEELLQEGYFSCVVSPEVVRRKEKVSAMAVVRKNNNRVLLVGTPFMDEDGEVVRVVTVMRNLTELLKLREELETAEKKKEQYKAQLKSLKQEQGERGFIAASERMRYVKELIDHVAQSDATVLITGETGSGKEVVAREIYKLSARSNGPYVKVNCAAIPDGLLESELFGYERGAFTGAGPREKKGYFEMANGGTILLDEISEMPLHLQPKILRVLQEKEITRVGGTRPVKLDIRIIASTNRVLKDMIAAGDFRADLYYRLNVYPIHLPSLRERRDDIRPLTDAFLARFNALYRKSKEFSEEAMQMLLDFDWPGNVRELENAVERMAIILPGRLISAEDVRGIILQNSPGSEAPAAEDDAEDEAGGALKERLAVLEKRLIREAVEKYGNSYAAADALGISQPSVVRKAHAYGIALSGREGSARKDPE